MFDPPFFALSQALQEATSFAEVSKWLSQELPSLVQADDVSIYVLGKDKRIDAIFGEGRLAQKLRDNLEVVNEHLPSHPLLEKVDLESPGERGVAVSDFISAEEYRNGKFNRMVKGDLATDDSMMGRVATCCGRFSLLVACRYEGTYSKKERQTFDVILYAARAALDRISSLNLEKQITEYLLTTRSDTPSGFFLLRERGHLLPVNHVALQLAERWWGEDEPIRILPQTTMERVRAALDRAWKDPVTMTFVDADVDLGGGEMTINAIQKTDGDIVVMVPLKRGGEGDDGGRAAAILTRRQREIMDWIAEGKTSAEAAIILNISPRTVEKHLEAVFQRLGVENRIAAVRRYLELKTGQFI